MPKEPHHIGGKGEQVFLAAADPEERLFNNRHVA
jgi:hypothetical protein